MSVGSLCSAGVWPVANPDHVMRWKFGREAEMAAGPFTASPGSKRFDVASAQRPSLAVLNRKIASEGLRSLTLEELRRWRKLATRNSIKAANRQASEGQF